MSQTQFQTKPKVVNRNSGIELLRFICITTIIMKHCTDINPMFGVCTFFAITGYYSVNKSYQDPSTRFSRFFKFSITTLTYTLYGIIIYSVFYLVGWNSWNPLNFFFDANYIHDPRSSWWFLYTMLFLLLFTPFINWCLFSFGKWFNFAIVLALFAINNYANSTPVDYFFVDPKQILYAASIYWIVAWFRLYCVDSMKEKTKQWLNILWIVIILTWILSYLYIDDIIKAFLNINVSIYVVDPTNRASFLQIAMAISCIMLFQNITLPNTKNFYVLINKIFAWLGKITLVMYLFHGLIWSAFDFYHHDWSKWALFGVTYGGIIIIGSFLYPVINWTDNQFKFLISRRQKKAA